MLRVPIGLVVLALLGAAADELALALSHSQNPAGGAAAFGYLAMLAACGLVFARTKTAALLAPCAGVFVVARFYTQDGSYYGFFRSYALDGYPSASFVYLMLALSFLAGGAIYLERIAGAIMSVLVLVVLLFTAVLFGAGY